jgi:hypothetical protein
MSLDSQTIRSESHFEMGALIQRNVGAVTDLWSRRAVQEQPNAKRVHHAVVRDHTSRSNPLIFSGSAGLTKQRSNPASMQRPRSSSKP